MYLKQSDLFLGIGHTFLTRAMALSRSASFQAGDVIFAKDDPALDFYILIDGSVELNTGEGRKVYEGSGVGELFGWSSLIGDDVFTASAVCTSATRVLIFNAAEFISLFASFPDARGIFYEHLSRALGRRLMASYRLQQAEMDNP